MAKSNTFKPGKHLLQIPVQTNLTDSVLRALDRAIIYNRGPEFAEIAKEGFRKLNRIVKIKKPTPA